MVAPTKVIAGIGASLGIASLEAKGATGDYHSKLTPKVEAIVQALAEPESQSKLGFLHIKAVDDASHDGDVDLKRDLISAVDVMVGQLLEKLWEKEKEEGLHKFVICSTGDHSTPVEYIKDHSHEPVPFSIAYVSDVVKCIGEENLKRNAEKGCVQLPYGLKQEYKDRCSEMIDKASSSGDCVLHFDEISAAQGMLGRFPGRELLPLFQSFVL